LRQHLDPFRRLQQIQKLLARQRFVVDDECGYSQGS
jgi:hypothetical protein